MYSMLKDCKLEIEPYMGYYGVGIIEKGDFERFKETCKRKGFKMFTLGDCRKPAESFEELTDIGDGDPDVYEHKELDICLWICKSHKKDVVEIDIFGVSENRDKDYIENRIKLLKDVLK